MSRIKTVFYDLDNTIYPQIIDVTQRIDYCIKTFFLPDANDIKCAWINEWLENGPLKHDLIERIIKKFSLIVDKGKLLSAYRTCHTDLSLERDTYELLSDMKSEGIKQFLITNGYPQTQLNKVRSLKIEELLDEVIIAVGKHSKPSNYWYKELLKKYNLDPKECLSVGDWYMVDGLASISADISFLHIKGGPVREDIPQHIRSIAKLNDIKGYLNYAYQ